MAPPGPTPPTFNQAPVAFANQIKDTATRNAVLEIFKQLGAIQAKLDASLGRLTLPLTTQLNAANNRLVRLEDPRDAQDAVTLRYLQQYVANFAATFSGSQAEAGGADGTNPETPIDDGIPDHLDVVTAIWNTAPLGPTSTDVELYRFCQDVANALLAVDPPYTCGLLEKSTGANIYSCAGESYSISRICYDNGHVFKILIDADPGGSRLPCWASNPPLIPDRYRDVTASGSC